MGSGTLTTPTSCNIGYMEVSQNIYTCGGTLPGWNCNPVGYHATVSVFTGGGCPEAPDLTQFDPTSLTGWATLPGVIYRSLNCIPPKKASSQDPSARILPCAGEGELGAASLDGEVVVSASGQLGTFRDTDFAASTVGMQGNFNPFLSAYDLAQTGGVEDLPGLLSILAAQQQGLGPVAVRANVRIEHWEAGAALPSHMYREELDGAISPDGRFDLARTFVGTREGEVVSIAHHTTYDGLHLRDLPRRGEFGNVFGIQPGYPRALFDTYMLAIAPLHSWLSDPFLLPMFESGVEVDEENEGLNRYLVSRTYPLISGERFAGEEFELEIRNGILVPLERFERNVDGSVRARWQYLDYFEVGGVWRPSRVILTDYLDSEPDGARVLVILQVDSAEVLPQVESELIPRPFETDKLWQFWS